MGEFRGQWAVGIWGLGLRVFRANGRRAFVWLGVVGVALGRLWIRREGLLWGMRGCFQGHGDLKLQALGSLRMGAVLARLGQTVSL